MGTLDEADNGFIKSLRLSIPAGLSLWALIAWGFTSILHAC